MMLFNLYLKVRIRLWGLFILLATVSILFGGSRPLGSSAAYDGVVASTVAELEARIGRPVNTSVSVGLPPIYVAISCVSGLLRGLGCAIPVGVCNPFTQSVMLDIQYLEESGPLDIESLVLHEMGHCEGGKYLHVEEIDGRGCPESIMYPETFSTRCYWKHRDKYWGEVVAYIRGDN